MTDIVRINFFNMRELSEVPKILLPGERLLAAVSGLYTAGTAILCVTTHRLLLVDKKLMRFAIEDVRFDSVQEVNYSHQMFFASLKLFYAGKNLHFRTWHRHELRALSQLIQEKMFEVRDTPITVSDEKKVMGSQFGTYLMNRSKQWNRAETLLMNRLSFRAGRLAVAGSSR